MRMFCVAAALFLFGCTATTEVTIATATATADPSKFAPAATPIPWLADVPHPTARPTPTPPPRPLDVRTCSGNEIVGVYNGGQGVTGWITRTFLLGTAASSPCLIESPTRAAYLGEAGTEIVGGRATAGWVVLSAGSAPRASDDRRSGQAAITLWTYGDCGPARPVQSVAFLFPDPTDVVQVELRAARPGGRCDMPDQQLRLGADFGTTTIPPLATAAPVRLTFSLDVPPTAVAGEALHYLLRVTNISNDTYVWSGCPIYMESLGGREVEPTLVPGHLPQPPVKTIAGFTKEPHTLNCVASGPIPSGRTLVFEMQVLVPRDALGRDTLGWELVGETWGHATAPLELLPPRH